MPECPEGAATERLKVLLLSNLFPTPQEPTRGTFNLSAFRALDRLCDARIVVPLPWWTRIRRPHELLHSPWESRYGMEASYPSYWSLPGAHPIHGRAMYASLRSKISRLRSAFPFDVILAAWAYPDGVAAAHLAHELNCPLVTMALGCDINEFTRHPGLKSQIQAGLRRSQRVIAVSHALKGRMIDLGIDARRIEVMHNGVDGQRFRLRDKGELRKKLGLPLEKKIIGYIGNFSPEKSVDTFVKAVSHFIPEERAAFEVALVGSGSLGEELRGLVQKLGLENVRFHGRRPHEEIPEWMGAFDALCLPSLREGCPNVVLESKASGRPVVASNVGGVPELIGHDTGVLVPPSHPEALAQGIREALSRRWEPEVIRNSVEFLSWERFGETLKSTLDEAVSEWRGCRLPEVLPALA